MSFDDIRFEFTPGVGPDFEGYTPGSWWALTASVPIGVGGGVDAKRASFSGVVAVWPDVPEEIQWRVILKHLLVYASAARVSKRAIETAWAHHHLGSPAATYP